MKFPFIALTALAIAIPTALFAQDKPVLSTPRVEGAMSVDGKLDEPFWQQAAVTDIAYETSPGENIPASVKTKVYIVDAGKSLRVAFQAQDPP